MAIISAIPNVLTSGNDVTASQLNTNFQHIADQVKAVMPEAVTESIELEGERYLTVDYTKLIPVLIEAIKELDGRVKQLERLGGITFGM